MPLVDRSPKWHPRQRLPVVIGAAVVVAVTIALTVYAWVQPVTSPPRHVNRSVSAMPTRVQVVFWSAVAASVLLGVVWALAHQAGNARPSVEDRVLLSVAGVGLTMQDRRRWRGAVRHGRVRGMPSRDRPAAHHRPRPTGSARCA